MSKIIDLMKFIIGTMLQLWYMVNLSWNSELVVWVWKMKD